MSKHELSYSDHLAHAKWDHETKNTKIFCSLRIKLKHERTDSFVIIKKTGGAKMEVLLFGLMIFIICITASYVTALLINRFSKNEYRFNFKFAVTNALFFTIAYLFIMYFMN